MTSPPTYPSGTTVNERYVLAEKLGKDGHVYEAWDRILKRTVAFKLLHPIDDTPRPWNEAEILEELRSQFIVHVINADVVTASDIRFIVTPMLAGGDLESAAGLGLGIARASRYGRQIAAGIDRIHAAGMVHRDIKPANVLLDGDNVVVSDLEYCELLDDDGHASRAGSWCTAAPEVARDDGFCSIRSDVYSLGATVFYLLSGEYPIDHRLPRIEQQVQIANGQVRDLRGLAPQVSQAVGAVVRRALHFDPERRFLSAETFGNALAVAANGAREWTRVEHGGEHLRCFESPTIQGRAGIHLCSFRDGNTVAVHARHPNGRRVSGVTDSNVSEGAWAKKMQRLISGLG